MRRVAFYRGRGVSLRFDDFLIAVIGTAWLLKVAINKDFGLFLRTPLNRPIAFYLLACVVATVNGYLTNPRVNPTVAIFYILKYFEYFLVYFMAVNHLKEREQIRRFVITMLVVCFLICLYGIYQIPSGDARLGTLRRGGGRAQYPGGLSRHDALAGDRPSRHAGILQEKAAAAGPGALHPGPAGRDTFQGLLGGTALHAPDPDLFEQKTPGDHHPHAVHHRGLALGDAEKRH